MRQTTRLSTHRPQARRYWRLRYTFTPLSRFIRECWIAQKNIAVNTQFGRVSGFGTGFIAFDWATIFRESFDRPCKSRLLYASSFRTIPRVQRQPHRAPSLDHSSKSSSETVCYLWLSSNLPSHRRHHPVPHSTPRPHISNSPSLRTSFNKCRKSSR